ncbi:GNAT family N-acetyltransferase [Ensifer sp. IC4062]|nr:GNAT family N-acetyltransferase [Ensifer sp. IC4062]MCA1444018.1 GNAT family N-acetyltransferase [Ensifer sp. IC4062]
MRYFFASQRLVARPFTRLDLDVLVAIRAEPEVARFQSWECFTEDDGRAFLESNALRNPGEPGWFQFALERTEDRAVIGDCGLKTFESDIRLAQIGYTIARQYWGQGYATEAVRGLIEYAFGNFPIHRITASVDPRNAASLRVLEKCGFVKEAHFRQSEWFKGAWVDDAVYAVLSTDERLRQYL